MSPTQTTNHQNVLADYKFTHPDTAAKVRAAAVDGDPEALKADIQANFIKEARDKARAEVGIPPGMPAQDVEAWKDIIVDAAADQATVAALETALPSSLAAWKAAGNAAEKALPAAMDTLDVMQVDMDILTGERDSVVAQFRPRSEIARERDRLELFRKVLVSLEVISAIVTCAVVYGLGNYPSLFMVPVAIWLEFGVLAVVSGVTVFIAPMSVRLIFDKIGWRGTGWVLLLSALALGLAFFAGFAILRWSALAETGAGKWGIWAMAAVAATPIVLIGAVADWALFRREAAEHELDALNAALEPRDRDIMVHSKKVAEQGKVVDNLKLSVALARESEAVFERELAAARARLKHAMHDAEHEAERAEAALTRIKRELPRHERIRFQRYATAVAMLIGTVMLASVHGCSAVVPSSEHIVVICDGTGEKPGCTHDALKKTVAAAFGEGSVPVEAGTVIVYASAGTPADVPTPYRSEPYPRAYGRERSRGAEWLTQVMQDLDDFEIPHDTPTDRRQNKSDVVGTMAVALEQTVHLDGKKHMIVMTDGRQIGGGIELDAHRGDASSAMGRISRGITGHDSGSQTPFVGFDVVRVCGVSHIGLDEDTREFIRTFWIEVLNATGSPVTSLDAECEQPRDVAHAMP